MTLRELAAYEHRYVNELGKVDLEQIDQISAHDLQKLVYLKLIYLEQELETLRAKLDGHDV